MDWCEIPKPSLIMSEDDSSTCFTMGWDYQLMALLSNHRPFRRVRLPSHSLFLDPVEIRRKGHHPTVVAGSAICFLWVTIRHVCADGELCRMVIPVAPWLLIFC